MIKLIISRFPDGGELGHGLRRSGGGDPVREADGEEPPCAGVEKTEVIALFSRSNQAVEISASRSPGVGGPFRDSPAGRRACMRRLAQSFPSIALTKLCYRTDRIIGLNSVFNLFVPPIDFHFMIDIINTMSKPAKAPIEEQDHERLRIRVRWKICNVGKMTPLKAVSLG